MGIKIHNIIKYTIEKSLRKTHLFTPMVSVSVAFVREELLHSKMLIEIYYFLSWR